MAENYEITQSIEISPFTRNSIIITIILLIIYQIASNLLKWASEAMVIRFVECG